MVLDNRNEVSVWSAIFLAFLFIVVVGSIGNINFGVIGIVAWIVVIISAIAFVLKLLSEV